jgi:hypothetical protein
VDHRVPFKSTKKRSRAPAMFAFAPNSRQRMRRIYDEYTALIQSGRPRLQTSVQTTQNYPACLIEGMVHNSHALSGAGVAHGNSFAETFAAIAHFDFGNRFLCFPRPTLVVGR